MNINYSNATIELTTAEAKKASKIGTNEYSQIIEVKTCFPHYRIVIDNSKKRKSSYDMKGLNYDFMECYILNHGIEEQLNEFNSLRNTNKDKPTAASYGEIKKWFLECFPEIKAASASKNKKEAV